MERRKVSIVTPFHNTSKWLPQCIESVLWQTFEDYEYILVDNMSTDGGGEIAARYASQDGRLRLLRTDHLLSQVENYNFALSQISPDSEYCKIVQADDWIYPEFIAASLELAKEDADIILVSSYSIEGTGVIPIGLTTDQATMSGVDACRSYFKTGLYAFGSPTAQLWRADVVRSRPSFYDARLAPLEDADVCFELLKDGRFGFVHQVLSYTRREEGSIFDRLRGLGWTEALRLAILRRWGEQYLTKEEYEQLDARWSREYRTVLTEGTARRAGEEFWKFHNSIIDAADMHDVRKNIFMPVLGWYLDRIGNPKKTCENLFRRLRRKTK